MALYGENVQIRCRTNMGATYHWILNGTRLEADQYRVPTPLGQLTIYGLAEEDLGEYVCIAQNEAGLGASHAMVTVGGKNRTKFKAKVYPLLEGMHVCRVLVEIIQCTAGTLGRIKGFVPSQYDRFLMPQPKETKVKKEVR